MTGQEKVPVRTSLSWLLFLGIFFYASYGLTNWLASLRQDVPSIVFSWERDIPFLAWTIVPYWTTNLFYAVSLFICRTHIEFASHVRRLLTAQVISVLFFLLLPLKFTFEKQYATGIPGFLFNTLGAFDKPFNQAPSLHVALTVILADLYIRVMPRRAGMAFACWSVLVILSVLTTYQHHFIDIPTGALLGLFCVWLWPEDGHGRLESWKMARGGRLRIAGYYMFGAVACAITAAAFRGWFLWMLWPAFSLICVSVAYLGMGREIFDKSDAGKIGWPARILLFPYLAAAWINSRLWTWHDPKTVEIADGVYLGRYPAKDDLKSFSTVIDLTCEFSRPKTDCEWICFPMLDLVAPEPAMLAAAAGAVEQAKTRGKVLVACALGYGRSVATLAVWLVRAGRAETIDATLEVLRIKRPRLSLSAEQRKVLTEAVNGKVTTGDCVVLLHGIGRTKITMSLLAGYFFLQGYDVINLDYASRQKPIELLAEDLDKALAERNAEKAGKVHFIGYSLGGLVIRACLGRRRPGNLGRVVMIGTPNHGSEVADFLKDWPLYQKYFGPAGQQLTTGHGLGDMFGNIDYDLGVIAGKMSIDPVSSLFLLPGKNDGKVSVESTRIEGMKDHIVLNTTHTFMVNNPFVMKQACYFIEHGAFQRASKQQRRTPE